MRTEPKPRLILDTNVIISGVLFKGEAIRSLLLCALNEYPLVFSQTTWDELASAFQPDAFGKIMALGARLRVLVELAGKVEVVNSTGLVTVWRGLLHPGVTLKITRWYGAGRISAQN